MTPRSWHRATLRAGLRQVSLTRGASRGRANRGRVVPGSPGLPADPPDRGQLGVRVSNEWRSPVVARRSVSAAAVLQLDGTMATETTPWRERHQSDAVSTRPGKRRTKDPTSRLREWCPPLSSACHLRVDSRARLRCRTPVVPGAPPDRTARKPSILVTGSWQDGNLPARTPTRTAADGRPRTNAARSPTGLSGRVFAAHTMIDGAHGTDGPGRVFRTIVRARRGASEEGVVEPVLAWRCPNAPADRGRA